jgi:hypothetical protein
MNLSCVDITLIVDRDQLSWVERIYREIVGNHLAVETTRLVCRRVTESTAELLPGPVV